DAPGLLPRIRSRRIATIVRGIAGERSESTAEGRSRPKTASLHVRWSGESTENLTMELPDREMCYRALQTRDPRFDGLLFVGVRSTGVYCRPVCPARTP